MKYKFNNLILGAGLSGLIANHYFTNSLVIEKSDKIGGNFLDKSVPKYLHNNKIIKELFKDLNIEPKLDRLNIGIYYNDCMYQFSDMSAGPMAVYHYSLKTKGRIDLKSMNRYLINNEDSYILNDDELIDALSDENIILGEEIKNIDLDNKIVATNKSDYEYKNLISTIPINLFKSLSGKNIDIEYMNRQYVIVEHNNHNFEKYNFIYYPNDKYLFNRMTVNEEKLTFEFPKRYDFTDAMRNILQYLNLKAIKVKKFDYISIPVLKNKIQLKSQLSEVLFLGRFAEGDYSIRTGDTIEKIRIITKNI